MNIYFHDKIQFQVIMIYQARDVADFNFKVHKSIEYLDLSTNDCRKKSIFTKEDLRKCIQPQRQILYKYHLDLPKDLESFCSVDKTNFAPQNAFHLNEIYVCDSAYGIGFETFIVEAIKSHGSNKIEKLKTSMKIIRLLNFQQCLETTSYFYGNIVSMLYNENCRDSKLVIDFVNLFNFSWWLFNRENPSILAYVLHHAQRSQQRTNLWRFLQPEMSPVSMCFLRHKIINVHILLMYGTPMIIPPGFNFCRHINISNWVFYGAVRRGIVSYRRAFLIFQLLYDYQHHQISPEGLRGIWRSIKDPFLSHSEIFFTLKSVLPLEIILQVHLHYVTFVSRGQCGFSPSPRPLKHLCRIEVRKLLNDHYQLPYGISNLGIPETLKSYLYEF